jgi:CRISPR-associated protein Cmr2
VNAHLLAISVGPVQGFIAAARRTRDLWFGSHLLSEISKAAAKSVYDDGGRLVFPAPEAPADLEPDSPLIVAKVILAELREADPKTLAARANEAAKKRWREYADASFSEYQAEIRPDIWND